MRQCMNEIYKLFGLEWPSLQPEVEAGEVETFASGNTATVVENKPSTPKLDQARTEKDKLDKTPSDLTTELVKVGRVNASLLNNLCVARNTTA